MWPSMKLGLVGLLAAQGAHGALEVDLDDQASIKKAAARVAENIWSYYQTRKGGFIGLIDQPPPEGDIHWWISGALWGTFLDYRHATGDTKYDSVIKESLVFQSGDLNDYMPSNWSTSIGNDDQSFWALSAMLAAETKMPDPPEDKAQYLALAQSVFNQQTRPDRRSTPDGNCRGGVRWQRYPTSSGYKYINSVSNACFFNLGVRLGRYTHNNTYTSLAVDVFDTLVRLDVIDKEFNVYDGTWEPNCDVVNKQQFSYNAALILQGSAFMYNMTNGSSIWKERVEGLISQTEAFFFPNGVANERACEEGGSCNIDQRTFKGYLHRWLASTGQLVPHTQPRIQAMLKKSAAAAIKICNGGPTGDYCSFYWESGKHNASAAGAVEQMTVLGALVSLLVPETQAPVSNSTGGTSKGNPDAGSNARDLAYQAPITTKDRAGAGTLTAVMVLTVVAAFAFMSWPEYSSR